MTLKRKIALVDLDRHAITIKAIPDQWRSRFLGGRGIGDYLLCRYGTMDGDALRADNTIVINAGLLGGTLAAPHAFGSILTKAPLTGFLTCSTLEGPFAAEMRWAGFDHLVLLGRSKNPVFLFINDGNIEIRDAVQFWGKTTGETRVALRQELGDREIKSFEIGPAGENLVRYATVMVDRYPSAGRTGLGAVLGSKKVKAIACRGTGDLEVKFPERILKLGPSLTTGNRSEAKGPLADESLPFSSPTMKAIEDIANDSGMDVGTACVMLQWACAMFEKGIIDRRHTRGLVLDRRNTESVTTLASDLSLGKNFGRGLGQGPLRLADKFGLDPMEWLTSTKSLFDIYSDTVTNGRRAQGNDSSEPAELWQLPGATGQVAVTELYDLISGCLGVACWPGTEKTSVSKILKNFSEAIELSTGLAFGKKALLTIAYRCYALERLFNHAGASIYRKQHKSDLNLDIPSSSFWSVGLAGAEALKKIRLSIDRHYKLNGWGPSKTLTKKVFGLLGIGDLWAVLRKR